MRWYPVYARTKASYFLSSRAMARKSSASKVLEVFDILDKMLTRCEIRSTITFQKQILPETHQECRVVSVLRHELDSIVGGEPLLEEGNILL